jgi:chemotaxis protein methyltransferase CheR
LIEAPAATEVESFRSMVAVRLGLHFEDLKLGFLGDVLRQRMEETGCRLYSAYQIHMASPREEKEEICALARLLTVGETYFFRYKEHFQAFADLVIPTCMQAQGRNHSLRILSAGCASGDEAYSLAIVMRERFPELECWNIEIHGFDINPAMVAKARRARYSPWSLRETSADVQSKYFRGDGRDFLLDAGIRAAVTFEERNLADDDPLFWQREAFDVVFCRNVTMYFTAEVMRAVIGRIARSLAPGGFLFLGHAETLRAISHEFHLRHTHETFYYQRREACEASETETFPLSAADNGSLGKGMPQVEGNDSWYSTIQKASERITCLTEDKNGPEKGVSERASAATTKSRAAYVPTSWDRTEAIDLMRRERFSEAIELLRALPSESERDLDAQLLIAALLTNRGDLPEAEKICRRVLALDELNAGAHYLMALCREHAGDSEGAVQHDQAASYLDAQFAMPHLHLGLLAKRSADVETAQRELRRALPLLDREEASRILLFGGGFTREALVEFCRRALNSCEGAS